MSEGSGENLFVVLKGELVTPPMHNSILAGITRASVLHLARELGYSVREMVMPRELLYVADEVFFTGTAVEVTPITSVDRVTVGSGRGRAGHQGDPAGVLRDRARRPARPLRLAHAGAALGGGDHRPDDVSEDRHRQ